jgi:uncharacterized linocin/CFP29 family protein
MSTITDGSKIQAVEEKITPDQIQVELFSSDSRKIGEVIGKGVSSYVCKGFYIPYNYAVALKVISLAHFQDH